jgi:two-component system, NarL family, invasion response regulator UvrY
MVSLLIADDHFIIRTGLKLLIKSFLKGSKIEEAENGSSVVEKIQINDYDLLILDINMPNTDSFLLVSNILLLKPSLKILMFSMNDEVVYAKRYIKMGAMGYLRKDEPEEEIKRAITTVLDNRKYVSASLSQQLIDDLHGNSSENPFDDLSPREFEIVQHLVKGESLAKICRDLNLQPSTVGTHKARIFEKLRCTNVIELNILAKLHHIISEN